MASNNLTCGGSMPNDRFFAFFVNPIVQMARLIRRLRQEGTADFVNRPPEGDSIVPLQRDQVLLVVLSLANGNPFTPVQIQKSLFLADRKANGAFATRYHFEPYDYGPFDRHVYVDAEALSRQGLAAIRSNSRGLNSYAATPAGVRRGRELQALLTNEQRSMIDRIVGLVRQLSFTELVSAIYRAYPEMRVRSVFRE
jgi:hypothetical protein